MSRFNFYPIHPEVNSLLVMSRENLQAPLLSPQELFTHPCTQYLLLPQLETQLIIFVS